MLRTINETTANKEILELNRMTKKKILDSCKKNKLYHTPALNDVLYLHFQGFESIENLEEYTDLKCLWLESNAISEIQNLHCQTKLKSLYLHSNLIRKIENLQNLVELDTLNLSSNHIRIVENCDSEVLPVLTSLNLSSNYLTNYESLRQLENCKSISVLDLANNRIDDVLVVKIFGKMPSLRVLVLQGNPVVSKISQYRKTLILECNSLTYLDSRPVFEKDRACAEAWKRGGYAEEREEINRWNLKERRNMLESVNATIRLKNKFRKPEDQISLCSSTESERGTDNVQMVEEETTLNLQDSIWDEVKNNIELSDSEKDEEVPYVVAIDPENNEVLDNTVSSSSSTENDTVSPPFISPLHSDEENPLTNYEADRIEQNFSENNEEDQINTEIINKPFELDDKDSSSLEASERNPLHSNEEDPINAEIIEEPFKFERIEEISSEGSVRLENISIHEEHIEMSEKELHQLEDKEESSLPKFRNINNCAEHLYCNCSYESESDSGESFSEINELIEDKFKGVMELMDLLQKHKHENELLSQIKTINNYLEDEKNTTFNICENIISEIILDLQLDQNATKNYKILEALRDECESDINTAMIENTNKSISMVVKNFNSMVTEKEKSLDTDKMESLNNLLESTHLVEYNADTSENVNKQLEYVQAKRDRHLRRMVDRVYAQRDKYNDSLEVIDNKLVIVKKDSGEIEDVPKALADQLSDSGDQNEYFQTSDYYKIFPNRKLGVFVEGSRFTSKDDESDSDTDSSEYKSLPSMCDIDDNLAEQLKMMELKDAGGDVENFVSSANNENLMYKNVQENTELSLAQLTNFIEKNPLNEANDLKAGGDAGNSQISLDNDEQNTLEADYFKILEGTDVVGDVANSPVPLENILFTEIKERKELDLAQNIINNNEESFGETNLVEDDDLKIPEENSKVALDNDVNLLFNKMLERTENDLAEITKELNSTEETTETAHDYKIIENSFLVQQSATIFEYYGETKETTKTTETIDETGHITANLDSAEFDDKYYFKTYNAQATLKKVDDDDDDK